MTEVKLNTRLRQEQAATRNREHGTKDLKACTTSSLDMGEASRWQGFLLNGCR
jgi:hypothetical protein